MSHPVLSGFSSAAAIIIALSQVKHLLGVKLPQTEHFHELLAQLARAVPQTNVPTLVIGNGSNELLAATVATFVGPGTPVVIPRPTFALYEKLVTIACGSSGP